ncbi:unnamed protein product [Calypogeia fissa]
MDALGVLREFAVRNDLDSVKLVGDEYWFGDEFKFPRNVETSYRSKQGSLYTLESLVYFVKNKHVKHVEYMQQARVLKLQIVTFTDRKPLQDFLEGKISTTDAIELLPPVGGHQLREDLKRLAPEEENEPGRNDENVAPVKRLRSDADGSDNFGAYFPEAAGKTLIETIRERERPVRDRESILECPNKNFAGVLALLNRRDEEKRRVDDQQKKESEKPTDAAVSAPNQGSRYANVEEKRFWKDHLGTDAAEELGIDPSQSFADSVKPKDPAAAKPKPDPRAVRPAHHPHHRPSLSHSGSKRPDGPPIILVPSASQTMVNTYNVKELLEDGIYITPEVKAKSLPKKPENVTLLRKMGRDHPVKYEVRDKPSVMSSKDWERVVAVFVLGKEWQFKDWPFKDHVEIFNKILGFYLRFEDDSVESAKTVRQWNVKIISLSKHKRHQDKTAVLAIWESLDKSIRGRKLNLVF